MSPVRRDTNHEPTYEELRAAFPSLIVDDAEAERREAERERERIELREYNRETLMMNKAGGRLFTVRRASD